MKTPKTDIKRQIINELHRPARKTFLRRHVEMRGINDLYQIDLIEMRSFSRTNKNYNYILVCIDCFSKFLWAEKVKSKSGKDVTKAMNDILKRAPTPKNIQSDQGREFYNENFKNLMKKYKINFYSTYSTTKASIIERAIRTIKQLLWKEFSYIGKYNWLEILQDIVDKYNSTIHSTTKMAPKNITQKHVKKLLSTVYKKQNKINLSLNIFKKGDKVRISKYRHIFAKSYLPMWSQEIFTISQIHKTHPITYSLVDAKNQPILGKFYSQELQKTKYPDVYLIDKIIKRKNGKLYVSWLGLKDRSWINKKDLILK